MSKIRENTRKQFLIISVDINNPVIIAEIAPFSYNLIDGNHRVVKALRLEISLLDAYKLDVKQHIQFLTEENAYHEYVEYWNDKLIGI